MRHSLELSHSSRSRSDLVFPKDFYSLNKQVLERKQNRERKKPKMTTEEFACFKPGAETWYISISSISGQPVDLDRHQLLRVNIKESHNIPGLEGLMFNSGPLAEKKIPMIHKLGKNTISFTIHRLSTTGSITQQSGYEIEANLPHSCLDEDNSIAAWISSKSKSCVYTFSLDGYLQYIIFSPFKFHELLDPKRIQEQVIAFFTGEIGMCGLNIKPRNSSVGSASSSGSSLSGDSVGNLIKFSLDIGTEDPNRFSFVVVGAWCEFLSTLGTTLEFNVENKRFEASINIPNSNSLELRYQYVKLPKGKTFEAGRSELLSVFISNQVTVQADTLKLF